MAIIGYHASQEQFSPSDLLRWAVLAKEAGFKAVNSSDHFHPWSERQGQSAFSFAWLGASLQATGLPHGVVCAPGYRYHPAIVAQAAATLNEMFPGKFWVSAGTGEALNERITGEKWPSKDQRNARLKESVEIMKRLFAGETVTHRGQVMTENARLYTRPQTPPLVVGAAVTEQTAAWLGGWADGLITISKPVEELQKVVSAFRENGGEGKPLFLKVQLSYDKTDALALHGAYDQWRTNIFKTSVLGELWSVEQFDAVSERVTPEEMREHVLVSPDLKQHRAWIEEYAGLGFDKIILHNVNRKQEQFISDFGTHVLAAY